MIIKKPLGSPHSTPLLESDLPSDTAILTEVQGMTYEAGKGTERRTVGTKCFSTSQMLWG